MHIGSYMVITNKEEKEKMIIENRDSKI